MSMSNFQMIVDDSLLYYEKRDSRKIMYIFKSFFLKENGTGNCFGRFEAPMWYVAEVEDDGNNIIVKGEISQFHKVEDAHKFLNC